MSLIDYLGKIIILPCCLVPMSYLTLCDPIDCSTPGSSVHGIFQARVLEWGAIAFSDITKQTFPNVWIPRKIAQRNQKTLASDYKGNVFLIT